MRQIRAGLVYFAIVFAVGFVLGSIRVPLLVPRIGVRYAELVEMPLMFLASLFAARYIVSRYRLPAIASVRLSAGFIALGLLLLAELLLTLVLMRQSLADYFASRDPVSGSVYIVMLGLFAVMPWLVSNARQVDRA